MTAGDDGRVRLFNYPCVVGGAPHRYACSSPGRVLLTPASRLAVYMDCLHTSIPPWPTLVTNVNRSPDQ